MPARMKISFLLSFLLTGFSLLAIVAEAAEPHKALDLAVLVDRSGSMRGPEDEMVVALTQFLLDQAFFFRSDVKAVVVPFASQVHTLPETGFFSLLDQALEAAGSLQGPAGETDMEEALRVCQKRLAPFDGQREKMAVMITDGYPEPSPEDPARFPQLAARVKQECSRYSPGSQKYLRCRKPFAEKVAEESARSILDTLLPAFGEQLPLYSIAIEGARINRKFLESCSRESTGRSDGFQVVTRRNLIAAANALFPKGHNVINIYQKQLADHSQKAIDDTFSLPLSLSRMRFVINYLDEGIREGDVSVEIQLPNGQTLGGGKGTGSYFVAKARGGAMVFERFLLPAPVPYGQGRVKVSRRGGLALPRLLLVAEGVLAQGSLHVGLMPPFPEAGSEVMIEAQLEERGRVIPIEQARGIVHAPDGSATQLTLTRMANGSFAAAYRVPQTARGKHQITVTAVVDRSLNQTVSGTAAFEATPPQAVKLSYEIPYGSRPQDPKKSRDSLEPDALTFPPLGCAVREYAIRGIRILNEARRPADLRLTLSPLTSRDGQVLNQRDWISLSMDTGQSTAEAPFVFDLLAKVPLKVPGDLQNATYGGILQVNSLQGNTLKIPVKLTPAVPSFLGLPDQVSFLAWWRLPYGSSRTLNLEIDGHCDVKGALICNPYFRDEHDNYVDSGSLSLASPEPGFEMQAGGSAAAALRCTASRGLRPGRYRGEVYVDGDITKDGRVPVEMRVPAPLWNPWPYQGPGWRGNILQGLHAFSFLLLLLAGLRGAALGRFSRFRPQTRAWYGDRAEPLMVVDPISGGNMFTVEFSETGSDWVVRAFSEVSVNDAPVIGDVAVHEGDAIRCREYVFEVLEAQSVHVQLEVRESPFAESTFRRPRQIAALAVLLLAVAQGLSWFF